MNRTDDPYVPPHRPVNQDNGFPPRSVRWMVKGMVIFTGVMVAQGLPLPLYRIFHAVQLGYGLRALTIMSIMLPFLLWLGNAAVAFVGMVFAWRYSRVAAAVLVLPAILEMVLALHGLRAVLQLQPSILPGVLVPIVVAVSLGGLNVLVHVIGLVGTLRYHRLLRQRSA